MTDTGTTEPEPTPRPSAVLYALASALAELEKQSDPDTAGAALLFLTWKVQNEIDADPARSARVQSILAELLDLEHRTAQRARGDA